MLKISTIPNAVARTAVEITALAAGAAIVGWVIGTAQYFWANRFWSCGLSMTGGCGFHSEEFLLAFWEGGLVGAAVAVPTGILGWYVVLARQATVTQMRNIVLGSLLGACILGALASLLSVFLTPVLTLVLAGVVRTRATTPPGISPDKLS